MKLTKHRTVLLPVHDPQEQLRLARRSELFFKTGDTWATATSQDVYVPQPATIFYRKAHSIEQRANPFATTTTENSL